MTAVDHKERLRAIDPRVSVIVQAPAGSGKTELLTQRFLALLGTVDKPESILAITFTRKAVGEMRQRIVEALSDARNNVPVSSDVKRQTRALAEKVLQRDEQKNWQLLDNPTRLQIMTIDALCGFLARQLPIAARFGAALNPVDDPTPLYEEAVEQTLLDALRTPEAQSSVKALLRHFSGNADALKRVVIDLLQSRGQWLPQVLHLHDGDAQSLPALKKAFEATLQKTLQEQIDRLVQTFAPYLSELARLSVFAQNQPDYKCEQIQWANGQPADVRAWQALAGWLLTGKGHFRVRVTKNEGFPPKSPQKDEFAALLKKLSQIDGADSLLEAIRGMPEAVIDPETWAILHAATDFAIRACAQLKLVMAKRGQADFTEIALAALQALGDTENPSELELMLDTRLKHILVDEFQDTSLQQLLLLEKLTEGWQPDDGRTLMVVGDPMQSIYRFRDANVAGFAKVQREGIGNVKLENIRLQANFRSSPRIINWVNDLFAKLFTPSRQSSRDAVQFGRAIPQLSIDGDVCIRWLTHSEDRANETEYVCNGVEAAINQDMTVAVLARNRNHLDQIAQGLRRRQIDYQAVELAALMDKAHIHDLVYLMLAMHQPLHPIYVPALLRSHWLGLKSQDVLAVMHQVQAEGQPFLQALLASEISDDGQARIQAYLDAFERLQSQLGGMSLVEWLQRAWQMLNGASLYGTAVEQDLAKLFAIVQKFDNAGRLESVDDFLKAINRLRTNAGNSEAQVHLMTIHKAKGLEFDEVFVVGLDRMPRTSDKPLFLWERNRLDAQMPLMAASGGKTGEDSKLYQWLRQQEQAANNDEALRVLYVACTRAKRRLHLVAEVSTNETGEVSGLPKQSMLRLVPELLDLGELPESTANQAQKQNVRIWRRLVRVKAPNVALPDDDQQIMETPQPWQLLPRLVGRLIHAELELAVKHWPMAGDWVEKRRGPIWKAMQSQGCDNDLIEKLVERVTAVLRQLPRTPVADLLDNAMQILCEPQLVERDGQRVRFYQPDLVIRHAENTYIIDYKTSEPNVGQDWATFVDGELSRYRRQLQVYLKVGRRIGWPNCQAALYFPVQHAFSSWIND